MSIQVISVIVLFILGFVAFWQIWPKRQQGADWRALYESAMSETNSAVLQTLIYKAESAVQPRQKELRSEPYDSPERQELGIAETALIRLKAEKLRWPVSVSKGTPT
jgi:CHASE3 domain sensor protein